MNRLLFLSLVLLAITKAGHAQSAEDTLQWLAASSFDLQTTNPERKIEAIPFEKIFENVQMVLVGEATHGTKEFAEIKHRLFRYLVENMGFRYFLIEVDFTAGLSVDQYICGNGGDPVEALKGLRYYHIVNKEGLALIKWMKSFNETKSASDQIRFFGIDCTISENAFAKLKDYFRRVDAEFYQKMNNMKLRNHRPQINSPIFRILTLSADTIEILKDRLTDNKLRYIDASSQMEYKIASRLAEILSQASEITLSDDAYVKRERFMAANVEWILNEIDPEPEKSFLWAHNAHVMYGDITQAKINKVVGFSLGKHLRNNLKGRVYSIGLHFNSGSFIANEIEQDTIVKKVWTVDEIPENRFLYMLSRTKRDVLFMDLHSLHNNSLISWLTNNKVKGYDVGGAYYPDHPAYNSRSRLLLECSDGLIFINNTHEITLDLE